MPFNDQMFNVTANSTTLATMNSDVGTVAQNYTVLQNSTLVRIDIWVSGQAATSLIEQGRIELTCTNWTPINLQRYAFVGGGLRTAPAFPIPIASFPVSLPCITAIGVKGQYLFNVTAVTPNFVVMGTFQ